MEKYVKLEKIGEGTYGIVFKGKDRATGETVAIKRVRMDGCDEGVPCTSIREISLLKELSHPNIVQLKQVILEKDKLHLVFEYLNMDLKKYMDKEHKNPLDSIRVKSFMYQLLQATRYLHMRRILHRDLKPQNLLVSPASGLIKVGDFGLGRTHSVPVKVYTHEVVTLWYRSVEILLGSTRYTNTVDVWALGCIFAEMIIFKPLFRGDSEIDQIFQIFRVLSTPDESTWEGVSSLPDYKDTFPKWKENHLSSTVKNLEQLGIDLLQAMLTYCPVKRITAKAAVKHPYFNNLDKSKLPPYD